MPNSIDKCLNTLKNYLNENKDCTRNFFVVSNATLYKLSLQFEIKLAVHAFKSNFINNFF